MGRYERLKQAKRQGQTPDSKQLSPELLYDLWWREDCTDDMIAKLFEVPRKKITNLRHKWNIKLPETIVQEFDQHFAGIIPTPAEDAAIKRIPQGTSALLRKIDELNDTELQSLRLELTDKYDAFTGVKQEVEFLAAVKRAVRTFNL